MKTEIIFLEYVRVLSPFIEFLSTAARFPSLELASSSSSRHPEPSFQPRGRRVLLADDTPNLEHRETREAFHAALARFLGLRDDALLVLCVSQLAQGRSELHAIVPWDFRNANPVTCRVIK